MCAGQTLLQFRQRGEQRGKQFLARSGLGAAAWLPENGDSDVCRATGRDICLEGWPAVDLHVATPGGDVEVLTHAEAGALRRATLEACPTPDAGPKAVCSDNQTACDRRTLTGGYDHAAACSTYAGDANAFFKSNRRKGGGERAKRAGEGCAADSTSGAALEVCFRLCSAGRAVGNARKGMDVL